MSGLVPSPQLNRKPNWRKWRSIPEVKVWQAVALSLDIDPDMVQQRPNTWMGSEKAFREGRDFKDRLDIACANVGRGYALTPVRYPSGHKGGYPVKVQEFADWCLTIDWSIPDGLRALASPSTPTVPPDNQDALIAIYGGTTTWVDAEHDERLREAPSSSALDDEPDTKTQKTYLRTIRALAVMANLIDQQGNMVSGAAGKVARRLEQLRFTSPKERRIRDLLTDAASLEPDAE